MDNNYHSRVLEYIEGEKVAFQGSILGSIHSYYLINDPQESLCDGFVRIHNGEGHYIEHEATFELLDSKIDATEVMQISSRIHGLQDVGIVYPYFTVFSSKLNVWVICYERFKQYNFNNIPVYEDNGDIYLSVTWKRIIRDVLCTLENLGKQGVSHGGVWKEENYVEAQGRVKLWNPRGHYIETNVTGDLKDLAQLLARYLGCHPEWPSFCEALRSDELTVPDLLQHPFIVDVTMRIRIVYAIYEFGQNTSFSHSVFCRMDGYRAFSNWKRTIPMEPVFWEVLHYEDADGNAAVYEDRPSGLIQYMRNLFEHGKVSSPLYAEMVMSRCFPNYVGAFFNLVKTNNKNVQFLRA